MSELTALTGTMASFGQASDRLLERLCAIRLSESTVERTTEAAGERLGKLLADGTRFGENSVWEWESDANSQTCAYVGIDAISIPRQGPNGAKAECRMAYVAEIYNPQPNQDTLAEHDAEGTEKRLPLKQERPVRYLAGFYDLKDLGTELRGQAGQVGWDEADVQIALTDGGSGLEKFIKRNFPKAICILDFWHAKEYLVEFSKAYLPHDDPTRQKWLDHHCHQLKHEGGAAVLVSLENLEVDESNQTLQESYEEIRGYYKNQKHRMDYPNYVERGWQIGSGPVESACKRVVTGRLKGSGMRWGTDGADAMCHLRALYLSEKNQWSVFWKDHPN